MTPLGAIPYICMQHHNTPIIAVLHSEESAQDTYHQLKFLLPHKRVLLLPGLEAAASYSRYLLASRSTTLSKLAAKTCDILVLSSASLIQKVPPSANFPTYQASIGDTINNILPHILQFGFNRVFTATEPGEFAIRGEIIDIVINTDHGYRIHLSYDKISSIKLYNLDTQISEQSIDSIEIHPMTEAPLNEDTVSCFKRKFLQQFGVNFITHHSYINIINYKKFPGYENIRPLLFDNLVSILDYTTKDSLIIYDPLCNACTTTIINEARTTYHEKLQDNTNQPYNEQHLTLPPELYFTEHEFHEQIIFNAQKLENFLHKSSITQTPVEVLLQEFLIQHKSKIIVIACSNTANTEKIKKILSEYNLFYHVIDTMDKASYGINIASISLSESYMFDDYVFISEQSIFSQKRMKHKTSSVRRLKKILSEIDSISEGELVVHEDYGIGKFLGIETLTIMNNRHDCIKIVYAGDDKLYVPVENMSLVHRYGEGHAELDHLGSASWQKRKSKLKHGLLDIAQNIVETSAKRLESVVDPMELNTTLYEQFCERFPYAETQDQLSAIEDVKNDLLSGRLMDRLICGDAGFGKTEVALRTAFIVASQPTSLQVAVIVPTTILCKQHYNIFLERFKDLNIEIRELSRLTNKAVIHKTKEEIKSGKINIVIGTSAILSTQFANLGLVIIDEEQHFGVKQKEKLKEIKNNIHILTISATPIPRTLQMSLMGIKDLSLITTPPVDRFNVHTTISTNNIMKDAFLKEKARGGVSFCICPRIDDIPSMLENISKSVPELTIGIAHGQMSPSTIDQVMYDFYHGKLDVLLTTSIVASGLDIPFANTIVINRVEMFGISTLYQLRGRVGRAKNRGYAYFILSKDKLLTNYKKVEIMQNADGFTIASFDMDTRGFGNILGEEQSGHVREVGIELYQSMLEDAIQSLRTTSPNTPTTPRINIGLSIRIPNDYVEDDNMKIVLYRRLSNINNMEELHDFKEEMMNRFGSLPHEFANLISVIEIKQKCIALDIEQLDVGNGGISMQFRSTPKARDTVLQFIATHPHESKLKPDNKLVFINKIHENDKIEVVLRLLNDQLQYGTLKTAL